MGDPTVFRYSSFFHYITMILSFLISTILCTSIVIAAPPVSYEEFLETVQSEQDAYADLLTLTSNDNGYGQMDEVKCRDEEKVQYVDKCVPYQEDLLHPSPGELRDGNIRKLHWNCGNYSGRGMF